MSSITLPTSTTLPNYEFATDLELVTYRFSFYWNERHASWYMTLLDRDRAPLIEGRRVACNTQLIGRSADARLPPGSLVALDTSGQNLDPGFADLGGRVLLIYTPSTELGG